MLAVAINHMGAYDEESFVSYFIKLFDDFKVIELSYCEDSEEERLQVCRPGKDTDLLKEIQQNSEPPCTMLKLSGPRAKLQKAVRSMFFPGQKQKYEKVLLMGSDILDDFPWAIRVIVVPLPVLDRIRDIGLNVGFTVSRDLERKKSVDYIFVLKTVYPDMQVFEEKFQEEISKDIKRSFEALFADYLDKRKRIKESLGEQQPGQLVSCVQACDLACELGVSTHLVGSVCDEFGYMITNCSLGCF